MNDIATFCVIKQSIDNHVNIDQIPTIKIFDNGDEMLKYWQEQIDLLSKDYDIITNKLEGNGTIVKFRKIDDLSKFVYLIYNCPIK